MAGRIDIRPTPGIIPQGSVTKRCSNDQCCGLVRLRRHDIAVERLRRRLRELRVYIELMTENMDYHRPRNHRTLEVEYRRLRRQLLQTDDDKIFKRFPKSDTKSEQTTQPFEDLRTGSSFVGKKQKDKQFGGTGISSNRKQNCSKGLNVRPGDLYRCAGEVAKREKSRFANNDLIPKRKFYPEQSLLRTDLITVNTPRECPKVPNVSTDHVTCASTDTGSDTLSTSSTRESSTKSSSKGRKVRFAPEVNFMTLPPKRKQSTSLKGPRKLLSVRITSVSASYYIDEPKLFYTSRAMALVPTEPKG